MLDSAEHDTDPAAPIDMLEAYYAAHGWEHERHDDEIVATVKGSWTTYELRALWREDDSVLQFLAFPDIKVAASMRRSGWSTNNCGSAISSFGRPLASCSIGMRR